MLFANHPPAAIRISPESAQRSECSGGIHVGQRVRCGTLRRLERPRGWSRRDRQPQKPTTPSYAFFHAFSYRNKIQWRPRHSYLFSLSHRLITYPDYEFHRDGLREQISRHSGRARHSRVTASYLRSFTMARRSSPHTGTPARSLSTLIFRLI